MATGKHQYSSTLKFNSNPTNDNKSAYKRVRSSGSVPLKKIIVNIYDIVMACIFIN